MISEVVLLLGVILYPASLLCPLLLLLFFAGCALVCGGGLRGTFPPSVVCASVYCLAVGFARACSFHSPSLLFVFLWVVLSFLFPRLRWLSLVLFSLRLLAPRCAAWDSLDPLEIKY